MFEDFVKWMASLSECEKEQKMEALMNLFAPSPSHEDFKRLKAAYKRKEKMVEKLKKEKETVEDSPLCSSCCNGCGNGCYGLYIYSVRKSIFAGINGRAHDRNLRRRYIRQSRRCHAMCTDGFCQRAACSNCNTDECE